VNLLKKDYPFSVQFDFEKGEFSPCQKKAKRKLSDLSMMFHAKEIVNREIAKNDPIIYEIFYFGFQTSLSDMALGVTRIQPGTIGGEYYMTKGHYHEAHDQPEIYFCVKGDGYLLLETRDGEFRVEKWTRGTISHIPPMWAHRVVNIGNEPLVFVASYHLAAGHEYEPIVNRGFLKRVFEENGKAVFILNNQRE
jgi:glucose-6-phosphate isomerase